MKAAMKPLFLWCEEVKRFLLPEMWFWLLSFFKARFWSNVFRLRKDRCGVQMPSETSQKLLTTFSLFLVLGQILVFHLYSCFPVFARVTWAVRQRHGSPPSRGTGLVGSHQRHRRARPPGGPAAGSAAAVPPPAEGQAEQHADRFLLHQPHRQLGVRRSRYSCVSAVDRAHDTYNENISENF